MATLKAKCTLSTVMGMRRKNITDIQKGTGITRPVLTNLYYDRASSIELDTLAKLCSFLECQPADLIEVVPGNEVRYEIVKTSKELRSEMDISEGCTLEDEYPELVESFDSKRKALRALGKYRSSVEFFRSHGLPYWRVTEYHVDVNEYDEDGDLAESGDIVEYSRFDESVSNE